METPESGTVTSIAKLQRQISGLRIAVVALAVPWLGTTGWLVTRPLDTAKVLQVERLEIVEPDGKPAIVLANSQRPIAATIDGQVIMEGQEEERKGTPSITFFDGKGDEVGGMQFGVYRTPDGFSAVRQLSLDGYKQDQTVVLSHNQDPQGSESGLSIASRPKESMLEVLKQLGLEPGATREELSEVIGKELGGLSQKEQEARVSELFGTPRAFFGANPKGEATLELRDGAGRIRVVLEAPKDGEPVLRFLDEAGKTVLQLPE